MYKLPLLSPFNLPKATHDAPAVLLVPAPSVWLPNPCKFNLTGVVNIVGAAFFWLELSHELALFNPCNLSKIFPTHLLCLKVIFIIFGSVTLSITNLALFDNFKSLKAPFNENLNLFVLFLCVNFKLVLGSAAPLPSTLKTALVGTG